MDKFDIGEMGPPIGVEGLTPYSPPVKNKTYAAPKKASAFDIGEMGPEIGTEGLAPPPTADATAPPPDATAEHGIWHELKSSFLQSSLGQNPEAAGQTVEMLQQLAGVGDGGIVDSVAQSLQKTGKDMGASLEKPDISSIADVHGIHDFAKYAASSLGNVAGSMAPSIIGAVGGGALGTAVGGPVGGTIGTVMGATTASAALNAGPVYQSLKDNGVDKATAAKYAVLPAAAITALDATGELTALSKLIGRDAKREIVRGLGKRMAQEIAKGSGIEGVTETVQQMIQDATNSLATGVPFMSKENAIGWVDNFVGGALGGGAGAAVGAVKPDVQDHPAGSRIIVNDQDAKMGPGPRHGQQGTVEKSTDTGYVVKFDDGTKAFVGNNLVQPAPEPVDTQAPPPDAGTPLPPAGTPVDPLDTLYQDAKGGATSPPSAPLAPGGETAPGVSPLPAASPPPPSALPILHSPEAAILRGSGMDDEGIADLAGNPAQFDREVEKARQSGAQPAPYTGAAPSAPAPAAPTTPAAAPPPLAQPSPGFQTVGATPPPEAAPGPVPGPAPAPAPGGVTPMTPGGVNVGTAGVFTPGNEDVQTQGIAPPQIPQSPTGLLPPGQATAGVTTPANVNEGAPPLNVGGQVIAPANANAAAAPPVPPLASRMGLAAVTGAAEAAGPRPRIPFQKRADTLIAPRDQWDTAAEPPKIEKDAHATILDAVKQHGLTDEDIKQNSVTLRRAAYLMAKGMDINDAITRALDEDTGAHQEDPNERQAWASATSPVSGTDTGPIEPSGPGGEAQAPGPAEPVQGAGPHEPPVSEHPEPAGVPAQPEAAPAVEPGPAAAEPAGGGPAEAVSPEVPEPKPEKPKGAKRKDQAAPEKVKTIDEVVAELDKVAKDLTAGAAKAKKAAAPAPAPAPAKPATYRTPTAPGSPAKDVPLPGEPGGRPYGKKIKGTEFLTKVRAYDAKGWYSNNQLATRPPAPKWLGRMQKMADFLADKMDMPRVKVWAYVDDYGLGIHRAGAGFGPSDIFIKDNQNAIEAATVFLHEFGHAIEFHKFNGAPKAVRDAIMDEYKRWRKAKNLPDMKVGEIRSLEADQAERDALLGTTPQQFQDYLLSFTEYFADQARDWLTTRREPRTAVEQFFKGVSELWRTLYRMATGRPGTATEIDKFMRGLWEGSAGKQVSAREVVGESRMMGMEEQLQRGAKPFSVDGAGAILAGTTEVNVASQLDAIPKILAAHPDAMKSPEAFRAMMDFATGGKDTTPAPVGFIKDMKDGGKEAIKLLKTMARGQIREAEHGAKVGRDIKADYVAGILNPVDTGKFFAWGMLSRQVSPYVQESAFLDSFHRLDKWIAKAVKGEFTKDDVPAYLEDVNNMLTAGTGRPGNGAKSNLNDYGRYFLPTVGPKLPELHKLMENHELTGSQIRDWFVGNFPAGTGISNKVFSFVMLVTGRPDVMVLDRVQISRGWAGGLSGLGKEGANLYSDEKMAAVGDGAKGLLIYKAMEREIQAQGKAIYTGVKRPSHFTVGRYHWDSWVAHSNQEASHGTLEAVVKRKTEGAMATQGEYGTFSYGARYGVSDDDVPFFDYNAFGSGNRFTAGQFRSFLEAIRNPVNGVVPRGFKVSESGNAPWFERQGIDQRKLQQLAREISTRPLEPGERPAPGSFGVIGEQRQVRSGAGLGPGSDGQGQLFDTRGGDPGNQGLGRVRQAYRTTPEAQTRADEAAARLGRTAKPVPEIHELEPSPANSKRFSDAISASKAGSKYGAAVYVYPTDDYTGMRTFLTPDGKSGFAIKPDGDIVSVFSDGGGKVHTLLTLAIEEGGTKLDAFDTALPQIYAAHGFQETSRDSWNDEYRPDGWNDKTFERWNGGKPDVVYMAQPQQTEQQLIKVWHGTPHRFSGVIEVEHLKSGKREFVTVEDGKMSNSIAAGLADNTIAVREHQLGHFDIQRIGTGEGAQVFGWGLYFAERKAIGKDYRDTLSKKNTPFLQVGVHRITDQEDFVDQVADANDTDTLEIGKRMVTQLRSVYELMINGETLRTALNEVKKAYKLTPGTPAAAKLETMIKKAQVGRERMMPLGSLYEVELHHDVEHFLHYDVPLAEQPQYVKDQLDFSGDPSMKRKEVNLGSYEDRSEAEAVAKVQGGDTKIVDTGMMFQDRHLPSWTVYSLRDPMTSITGGEYYHDLGEDLGSDEKASKALKAGGIAGIRYLDSTARKATPADFRIWNKKLEQAKLEGDQSDIARWTNVIAEHQPTYNYVLFDDRGTKITRNETQEGTIIEAHHISPTKMNRLSRQNAAVKASTGQLPNFQIPSDPTLSEISRLGFWNVLSQKGGWKEIRHVIQRFFQDSMVDIRNIEDAINGARIAAGQAKIGLLSSVYQISSLFPGRAAHEMEILTDTKIKPILTDMAKAGITQREMDDLLTAMHAPERNASMRAINPNVVNGSGMSDANAAAIVAKATPQAMALAQRIQAITKETAKYQWEHGLITPENAVQFGVLDRAQAVQQGILTQAEVNAIPATWKHYVPLKGWEGEIADGDTGTGTGFNVAGKEFKKAFGRDSRSDGPSAYIFNDAARAIVRGQKNEVGLSLYRLVTANPNPELWEINRPQKQVSINPNTGLVQVRFAHNNLASQQDNVFTVKIGGKERHIEIFHAGAAEAMKALGNQNLGTFLSNASKVNRYLSMINTSFSPEWFASNIFRDLQTALVQIGEEGQKGVRSDMIKNWLPAMKGAFQGLNHNYSSAWGKVWQDYEKAGGKVNWVQAKGVEEFKSIIDNLYKDHNNPNLLRRSRMMAEIPLHAFERFNSAAENAIRLTAFKSLVDRGYSHQQAASVARELTVNFNRRGQAGPVLNSLYLFYNASVQGNVRLFQSLAKSNTTKALVGTFVTLGIMEPLLASMVGGDDGDDDWYERIPQFIRDRSFILPGKLFGWTGQDPYIRVPIPYGLNVFKTIGAEMARVGQGKIGAMTGALDSLSAVVNAFNPFASSNLSTWQGWAQAAAPTLMDPLVDLGTNTGGLGSPIHPSNDYDKRPAAYQSFRSNSTAANEIAQFLNTISGGDKFEPGAISVYPGTIDYAINYIAGGIGRTATTASTLAGNVIMGTWGDITSEQVPFARTFTGHAGDDRAAAAGYYDVKSAAENAEWQMKQRAKVSDTEGSTWLRRERKTDLQMAPIVKAAEKQLAAIKKMEKATTDDTNLDSTTRKQRLDVLQAKRLKIQSDVMRKHAVME